MDDAQKSRLMSFVVWSVWIAMTLAALGFVGVFGSDVPYWDEWNIVDFATGAKPVTLQWLWSPHNGHRIPVPKLLLLSLYKLTGTDFRSGMYFNVVALSGAAAALMWASRRLRRGKQSVADAIFPLLLLHWGHYENLLWSWQTSQVLPVVVVCGVLAIMVAYGMEPPFFLAVIAAAGILSLPLSGVPGLTYAPALAAWLAVTGAVAYRAKRQNRAIALWAATAMTLALVGFYFVRYKNISGPVSVAQPVGIVKTAMSFAAEGLGPGISRFWPAMGILLTVVLLVTFAALASAVMRNDPLPSRGLAILFFVAGAACLVAAFATGRTGTPFVSRYFLLSAPMWCCAFFAWPLSFRPTVTKWAQRSFLIVAILLMPLSVSAGLRYATDYHGRMERFRADLLAGMSPSELVAHHVASLCPCPWWFLPKTGIEQAWGNRLRNDGFPVTNVISFADPIRNSLCNLHDRQIGDFARMRISEPRVREIVLSHASGFTIQRPSPSNGIADSVEPAVLITPDHPLYLIGIRIRRPPKPNNSMRPGTGGECVQVYWRSPGESAYMAPNRYVFFWDSDRDEQMVWIYQTINQVGLHLGDRDTQRALGSDNLPLTLVVPERISANHSRLTNH